MKSDPNKPGSLSSKARANRAIKLNKLIDETGISGISVIDVGGTMDYWGKNLQYFDKSLLSRIDIINLPPIETQETVINGVQINIFPGDALKLHETIDRRYDLVFSNSVIEHVDNLQDQKIMADAIMELGEYWFIQTPNPFFLIDSHSYFPYFYMIPLCLRAFLHRNFNLGFYKKQPDWLKSRIECENTRLLTLTELMHLFPGSKILKERILGFTKSFMVTNLTNE